MDFIEQLIQNFESNLTCDCKTKEGRKQIKLLKAEARKKATEIAKEKVNLLTLNTKENEKRIKVLGEDWEIASQSSEQWLTKECVELEIFLINELQRNAHLLLEEASKFDFHPCLLQAWVENQPTADQRITPETTKNISFSFKDKLPCWLVSWFGSSHQTNEVTANLSLACKEVFCSKEQKRIDFAGKVYTEIHSLLSGKLAIASNSPRWERW